MKYIHFTERLLSVVFLGLVTFGFDLTYIAVLTVISAIIHECGHLIAIRLINKEKTPIPRPGVSGFRITRSRQLSYPEELFISLGGPLINIIVFLSALILPKGDFFLYLWDFGLINLMSALSNLLPIESYDGHKILRSLLYLSVFEGHTESILTVLSFFFSALLTFLSLYLILRLGEGFWIFCIFFSSLLSLIIKREKAAIFKD